MSSNWHEIDIGAHEGNVDPFGTEDGIVSPPHGTFSIRMFLERQSPLQLVALTAAFS